MADVQRLPRITQHILLCLHHRLDSWKAVCREGENEMGVAAMRRDCASGRVKTWLVMWENRPFLCSCRLNTSRLWRTQSLWRH